MDTLLSLVTILSFIAAAILLLIADNYYSANKKLADIGDKEDSPLRLKFRKIADRCNNIGISTGIIGIILLIITD